MSCPPGAERAGMRVRVVDEGHVEPAADVGAYHLHVIGRSPKAAGSTIRVPRCPSGRCG
jgi:hypothetical protein